MNTEVSAFTHGNLFAPLREFVDARRWVVAFSGGLDSTVLLHALVRWRAQPDWPGPELMAIHVNHGLSSRAQTWEQHCLTVCGQWDVRLIVESVEVTPTGEGVEAAAREARYRALEKHLREGDIVLTAHHRDDQAETFFLRLLRGSGAKGLSAMAPVRVFGPGRIVRPLLGFSRRQLAAYAEDHRLRYCDDDSNTRVHYDRNFLRQRIIPELEQRWPNLSRRWSRTARILRDSEDALAELAAMDLAQCDEREARLGWCLDWTNFTALSPARRHNLIRYWCGLRDLPLPAYKHLRQLDRHIARQPQTTVALQWHGTALRSFAGDLYLLPAWILTEPFTAGQPQPLPAAGATLLLPDRGRVTVYHSPSGLNPVLGPYLLSWRAGGERCRPQSRRHSQSLKKCLQEASLEPWLRDRVPLIHAGEDLAAVGDLWVCHGFAAGNDAPGLGVRWDYTTGH